MAIYDFHAHIYPDKIAARAVEGVGSFYNLPMAETGTVDRLLEIGQESGITNFIVHSVATVPKQVESINNFVAGAVKEHPETLTGFGTMHADYENKEEEIERFLSMGLSGLKIHPDSQHFYVDDEKMFPVYDMIQGRIPIQIHCGDYRYDFDHPRRIRRILKEFPRLTVIAAHFGGWSIYDLATEYLQDVNCYFDCSSSIPFLGDRRSVELIRMYGAERMLFGSDYPMWSPKAELEHLYTMGLTDEELSLMLFRNAERILGK